ncbi:MAG: transcription-repair coupling factor [Oscillospiraceae bacterium]
MAAFREILKKAPEYADIKKTIEKGRLPAGVLGLSQIHKAHLIDTLCGETSRKALVVLPDEASATRLCDDLKAFGANALLYPTRDFSFTLAENRSHEYEQKRLRALTNMLDGEVDIVVCCVEASIQRTIPKADLKKHSILIKKGIEIPIKTISQVLMSSGYTRTDMVEGVGQFSIRGGILDLFSPDDESPIRIEFWGDSVETMSHFDLESQRRCDKVDEFSITPSTEILFESDKALIEKIESFYNNVKGKGAVKIKELLLSDIDKLKNGVKVTAADKYLPLAYDENATIFDYAEDYMLFVCESAAIKEKSNAAIKLLNEEIKYLFEEGILCKGLDKFCLQHAELLQWYEKLGAIYLDNFARGSFDTPVKELITITAAQLPSWNGKMEILYDDIKPLMQKDATIVVMGGTEKGAKTLAEDLDGEGIPSIYFMNTPSEFPKGRVSVLAGTFSNGFSYPHEKSYVFTYGRAAALSKTKHKSVFKKGKGIHSLDELHKGDYVVHSMHGIGVFEGIQKLEIGKITKDYIKIKYAKSDVLYVPVTQLDLVSKYIGPHEESGRTVKLNKIGGKEWEKTKNKVRSAVKDMADELIALYAKRQKSEGFAFSPDMDMQSDFERRFPYDETSDQLRSIDEIKGDMEKPYPMDRLLCGDVGFGKTEVALRAAFKCVADGKQCAILVPTTILALQHYRTIMNRFDGFPIEAEMLSRFRTPKEQEKILKGLKRGSIDIVVGTHRLVSKDIAFKDLGLLVVDEEQRFGVAQKEKLKEKFPTVDVLTLSATPIPRTLNMAMSGIRDMSVIEQAPSDRYPVQTYVLEHDMGILAEAMEKELRRGGQVYFLHNRVETIDAAAGKIKEFLPDANVVVAHGKMPEEELSEIWRGLLEGEIDILVCTTIIETGVDVPNVNTIIIENADRLGLAQLHQIRGRVGRSARRAAAYLTFTRGKELTEIASRRLSAIREYTEFGSGFKIAMRDLEIRGAGNVLGAQQHGHMEAVGYDMYLQLLGEAVSEEKGEKSRSSEKECLIDMQIDAHIPDKYIDSIPQRLAVYRRIADIRNIEDADDVRDELIDRFGDIPDSVAGLIDISLLRNTAADRGIYEIGQKGNVLILYVNELDTRMVLNLSSVLRRRVSVADSGKKHIAIKILDMQEPLDTLKEVFSYLTV